MKKRSKILTPLLVVLLIALIVAANIWKNQSPVQSLRVDIDYCGVDTLVRPAQVEQLVRDGMPGLASLKIKEVDLKRVATLAAKSPWLKQCEASTSIGGTVVVHAVQRRPIVRVCSRQGEYYLDDSCHNVPISKVSSCDVIVASGNIPAKGARLKQVWTLAKYLDTHADLAPLFDQIYLDGKGDLYLTPKLGNHVVQIGNSEELDSKFHNLMELYDKGLSQAGWETYSQVSVKYHKQVVCTRRDN